MKQIFFFKYSIKFYQFVIKLGFYMCVIRLLLMLLLLFLCVYLLVLLCFKYSNKHCKSHLLSETVIVLYSAASPLHFIKELILFGKLATSHSQYFRHIDDNIVFILYGKSMV